MVTIEGAGRIAVLRALKLGDLLCAVPAFRALRKARPDAEITLIGLPWAEAFVERFAHLVDAFLEFPGWPGMPEREAEVPRMLAFMDEARARRFDLAIQMHGDGSSSNAVVGALGAKATAGYAVEGAVGIDPYATFPYPSRMHEVHRHLALLEHLGVPSAGDELEFPVTARDIEELTELGVPSDGYAVVHPGAVSGRRWPPERFASFVDAVGDDVPIVLTGTDDERELTAAVATASRLPMVDLAGRTSLGALAALLRDARLVVANDTGVSHLAAAVGAPSVVLFLSSDPRRWAPLDAGSHRSVVHPAIDEAHAIHGDGALDERCLREGCELHPAVWDADVEAVTLDEVLDAARGLLYAASDIR